jgi:hypothetical protein
MPNITAQPETNITAQPETLQKRRCWHPGAVQQQPATTHCASRHNQGESAHAWHACMHAGASAVPVRPGPRGARPYPMMCAQFRRQSACDLPQIAPHTGPPTSVRGYETPELRREGGEKKTKPCQDATADTCGPFVEPQDHEAADGCTHVHKTHRHGAHRGQRTHGHRGKRVLKGLQRTGEGKLESDGHDHHGPHSKDPLPSRELPLTWRRRGPELVSPGLWFFVGEEEKPHHVTQASASTLACRRALPSAAELCSRPSTVCSFEKHVVICKGRIVAQYVLQKSSFPSFSVFV